ncbi:MAG: cob(I)yrinic acid a,c-diamide adenosyltransferase [Actinomycetota bacterium]
MRIYTRRGDDGSTGLLFGGRVAKDDVHVEACGAIDESVAALGLARAAGFQAPAMDDLIQRIQRNLFVVGADLAILAENRSKLQPEVSEVTERMVQDLEGEIDKMVSNHPLPDYFVLPGSTQSAAALDMARVLVRRAERRAVTLFRQAPGGGEKVLRYLNRLSDLLFVAARAEEASSGRKAEPSRAKN